MSASTPNPKTKVIAWVYDAKTGLRDKVIEGYVELNQFKYKEGGFTLPLFGQLWAKDATPHGCDLSKKLTHGKLKIVLYKDDGKDWVQIDPFSHELYNERSPSDFYRGVETDLNYIDTMMADPNKGLTPVVTAILIIALAAGIFFNYLQAQQYQQATQSLVGPMNKTVQLEAHWLPILINDTANNTRIIQGNTRALNNLAGAGG
jgi:hypothetical protein